MLNYWWVTRPKRKLNSVPEVLATIASTALDQQWAGCRDRHLSLEEALEQAGLKRIGDRRDQGGGGARTYTAWLISLGLIFHQEGSRQVKLTLAGEAIMNGDSPVSVLKNQIIKYQFPSAFSVSRGVNVAPRFKIHPFVFLLRLLDDPRIGHLTQEEIAKIVITEADSDKDACFEHIVQRIQQFRDEGDCCLPDNFAELYTTSKGLVNYDDPFSSLLDISNTLVNWLEYTQLAKRDIQRWLQILPEKAEEVKLILKNPPALIARPDQHEFFQRKYGIDPKHHKDTRNLIGTSAVTLQAIAENKIKSLFISESLKRPISSITAAEIDAIATATGFDSSLVEDTLRRLYPHGAIGGFMTNYFEMAFKGREEATEFEKATVELFQSVFGYTAKHVGPIGLTPDVLLLSDSDGYQAIIDNKAYSYYTISNDHRNRMIHNYIHNLHRYSSSASPLAFFSYIAGGFGPSFDGQVRGIADETGIPGSGIAVANLISCVEQHTSGHLYTHSDLRRILSCNRIVERKDL